MERETSGFARGTDVGWYRIAETYQNNSDSYSFLLGIQRSYGNTNNETYLFSICISYRGRISITQLSGSANIRLIDKIRVDWGRNAYYIDLYINTATDGNTYRWYTVGAAKSYTAWTANPTLNGTAYEFTTVNGCKSDLGFTGNIAGNATSATKLATPRTITLTGSVTGSVSIDGSQNVSLATTTNHTHNYAGSSSAGGSANSALTLLYNNKFDTTYGRYAIFQQGSNISDFPHTGWFNSIKMLHNNSSGYFTEIAMSFTGEDGMWRRALRNGAQVEWYKMLDSGNYNSYCPKLDGTGATGTWGISISGNADTLDGYHETGFYRAAKQEIPSGDLALLEAGSYYAGSTAGDTNPLPSTYASLSVLGKSYYATQLCVDYNGSAAWLRGIINSSSGVTAYGWHQLAFTDSNVASATKLLNSRTIWGQSFDGTGNVSGSLTGTNFLLVDRESNPYLRFTEKGLNGFVQFLEGKIAIGPTYAKSLVVDNNGNVGIGTTSPSYKLHIVGVAYASEGLVSDGYISSAATSTSSDIRLKDNISEISSEMALKWLSMLKPKSWSWNSFAGVKGRSMGFVAQDVEGILPQMIRKRNDSGYLSLDYTQLHALEVSALQSHEKRIEELERENKILKEELNKLKLNAN